jgi:AraC-like DNA-binding protein
MFLLRETDRTVTDVCFDVGFTSLGTFSRTFHEIVGQSPSEYRDRHEPFAAPNCFQMMAMRPLRPAMRPARPATRLSSFGEATGVAAP